MSYVLTAALVKFLCNREKRSFILRERILVIPTG